MGTSGVVGSLGVPSFITEDNMRTLLNWIKEFMIIFLLTSMVLLTAAIGTIILLNF